MSHYEDQYRAWVDSLSDKQRAKLKAKGLDKPLDDFKLNTPDSDIAFAKMGEDFDYDQFDEREAYAEIETLVEERAKAYGAQLLSWVFARLQAHKSARSASIDRDALVFALGMARRQNGNRHCRAIRHYEGGVFRPRKIVAKAFGIVAVVVYA